MAAYRATALRRKACFVPIYFKSAGCSSDHDHRERTDRICGGIGQNDNSPRQPLRPPGPFYQVGLGGTRSVSPYQ
jgi:hypothetical protein